MSGRIVRSDILADKAKIISAWGLNVFMACLVAKPNDTFLNIVMREDAIPVAW